MPRLTTSAIEKYCEFLVNEEKAAATVSKYRHDLFELKKFLSFRTLTRSEVLAYKSHLSKIFAPASVNAAISSLNGFFSFMKWYDLKVKRLKLQKTCFIHADRMLTKEEYEKLLRTASEIKNERLCLLMQTICSTGIRVSEVPFVTVEAVALGRADVKCKGKRRPVFLPKQLCIILKKYIKEQKIKSGAVFVSKNGNPLDRSNIWSEMKKLCKKAGVSPKKVFPHNLRHLFARTFYRIHKDIVRLADLLGHASVNTTRIYTADTIETCRRYVQALGLLRC